MTIAADAQVYTGPTASFVHHSAAWVQAVLGTDAAVSLGVVLVAALVVCVLAVGAGGFVIDRFYSGDGP